VFSVAAGTEQDQQKNQDPDPFVVFKNIAEASHIFTLSFYAQMREASRPSGSPDGERFFCRSVTRICRRKGRGEWDVRDKMSEVRGIVGTKNDPYCTGRFFLPV